MKVDLESFHVVNYIWADQNILEKFISKSSLQI